MEVKLCYNKTSCKVISEFLSEEYAGDRFRKIWQMRSSARLKGLGRREPMGVDLIVKEIREIQTRHAAQFNNDWRAIYNNLKQQEKKSKRTFVSYPPKLAQS